MKDQIRAEFEQEFPLPNGVTFDGDHYVADPSVMGSFSNATIWSHMYRGWKTCSQPARQVGGDELVVRRPQGGWVDENEDTLERLLVGKATEGDQMLAANQLQAADIYEDVYGHLCEILEPHIHRVGKEGFLPASIVDSIGILLEQTLEARAALAPAAVVMPDHKTCDDAPWMSADTEPDIAWRDGYNAAIDEVKSIPASLLRRIVSGNECAKEIDELRALLGKE